MNDTIRLDTRLTKTLEYVWLVEPPITANCGPRMDNAIDALLALGLIECGGIWYRPTDAGRAALSLEADGS